MLKDIISPYWACLCNSITRQSIALDSSSNSQKSWRFFWFAMNKFFLVLGFRFFVGDVISGVDLVVLSHLVLILCSKRCY